MSGESRPIAVALDGPGLPSSPILLPASIASLLPSRGFIRDYIELNYRLTEAPAETHLAGALVSASALVGKGITLPWADDLLYLNIWVALVGPSTVSRKTTALRKSESIVRAGESNRLIQDDVHSLILPDDSSAAALIDLLAQNPERVWYLSELGLLFAQCEAKFNVGLKQQLANLYDVPLELASARRGTNKHSDVTRVQRPYLTILGATTTAWLTDHLTESDLLGGLYGRFLFVPIPDAGPDGRRISIPPAVDATRKQRVVEQATHLYGIAGTLDPERIRGQYDRWYRQHGKELHSLEDRDRLGSFWGRLETYCLKLAALHEVSLISADCDGPTATTDVWAISPEALDLAIELVEVLKRGLVQLLQENLHPNKVAAANRKVIDIIRRFGGRATRRDVQRKAGLLPESFKEVIRGLLEDGRLKQEKQTMPSGQTSDILLLGEDDKQGA